ncbi:MAG TPA: glycosyltransferase family 2 protein [Cyclobacteriaceae bacterium]|nr:glycosyltransferase family 2 protein [Cyclobacteriaceae bacterium]
MQKAAIVILNYNGEEMLKKFLPSVVNLSTYNVIVADNASTDGSVQLLAQQFPQLQLIRLNINHGFANGYNLALAELKGQYEYYILLNSDIQVTADWDVKMIQWLDNNPHIVAAQPKILSYQDPSRFDHAGAGGGFLDQLGYPYCRGRIFNHTEKDLHQYDDCIEVDWASGACLFIRATDFHAFGGFDKSFFAHMEEIDLCWRLRHVKKAIFYNGTVQVYHVNGGTLSKQSPFKTYLNFRNNILMLYKNLPVSRFFGLLFCRIVLDFLALLHFSVTEGAAHGKAVAKAYFDFFRMRSSVTRTYPLASKLTKHARGKKTFSIAVSYYLKGKRTYAEL